MELYPNLYPVIRKNKRYYCGRCEASLKDFYRISHCPYCNSRLNWYDIINKKREDDCND